MTTRFFLLLERQQRLDARLRLAQQRSQIDLMEIARLRELKRALRKRLAWLMQRPLTRPA